MIFPPSLKVDPEAERVIWVGSLVSYVCEGTGALNWEVGFMADFSRMW